MASSLDRFVVVPDVPEFWICHVVDVAADDLVVMAGLAPEEAAEWAEEANRDHRAGREVLGRGGPLPVRIWPPRLI